MIAIRNFLLLLLFPIAAYPQTFTQQEVARFKDHARMVTIVRDKWGIPHIYGKTDADAVFGLLYAQCEENFPRIEKNYLEMMGRLSEVEGKTMLYQDLEMRLIYDSAAAMNDYRKSPPWFQQLLNAFADGVNYYLYTHPSVKPLVITKFQPWFPLMYTDGSIAPTQTGGLTMQDMKELYKINDTAGTAFTQRLPVPEENEPSGSNGFAVSPSKTSSGSAILYINPHVTFYFRSEVQMVSEEGLNAYGAVTWGQFFVYQGFNEHCGWMHTSSYADVADLYQEKIRKKASGLFYEYDEKELPIKSKNIIIRYRDGGTMNEQLFTTYSTHHGPVMGSRENQWLSLRENNRSLSALMQSWLRTKANGFESFKKVMEMRSNNSNNTVFADDKGNIAYWHGNFMPKRDPKYQWSLPVDGSTSATEWKGIHELDEIVHVYNPSSGWIQNCNSTPFTSSGNSSPMQEAYPSYMAADGQNFRALNAARLLSDAKELTIDKMIRDIGYSHYLSAFEVFLPPLFQAYDKLNEEDSLKLFLREPVLMLRSWDRRSAVNSIPAALALEWAYRILPKVPPARTPEQSTNAVGQFSAAILNLPDREKLILLAETMNDLEKRFGTWLTTWGQINCYQRPADGQFDDNQSSIPVGLAAATWGSLPSFSVRRFPNTSKRYGVSGNSFIACVEFGKKIKAKSVITGGQSFDPNSKHYTDQANRYIDGNFKDVLFYKEDVLKNAEKKYHPGEEFQMMKK